MREHTTHFDDCGCQSARYEAEIVRLREALSIGQRTLEAAVNEAVSLRERLAEVEPVVRAAVALRKDYPQLAPVSEINRFARNNGLPDDPVYAMLLAVDALRKVEGESP